MNSFKIVFGFMFCILFLNACAAKEYQGPSDSYYSDVEYSARDNKWYHKSAPPSARDIMLQGGGAADKD